MTEAEGAQLRVVIYARVSTEEQREGQTINSQVAELEQFARNKGWAIEAIYKDEGWSGSIISRPALDRLRDDARGHRFQVVLINDVDRLARDVAHLGVIKRDLEIHELTVIFRKLPSEAGPISNLLVNILGSFAEFERELIIDRTRRGRRHKVEGDKRYLGSISAYGYRYHNMDRTTGKEGRLEVEPYEAGVVRLMFGLVDREGLSANRVVQRLNERFILPRRAGRWGKSSVLKVLHNEMYTGIWHYNKFQCCEPQQRKIQTSYPKRVKSSLRLRPRREWIPLDLPDPLKLVPRDCWERVQRRLTRNICFSPRNEKHFYLLKGLIRCGGCGNRYVGDSWYGRFYYRCSARCKRLPAVRDYRLDNIVADPVEALVPENLKSLEPEQRREVLRRVIQDAIFDGSTVTIRSPEPAIKKAGGHNITDLPSEGSSIG
ncbi:MAG: recombinase family protein [Acidobacteriota bacterium]